MGHKLLSSGRMREAPSGRDRGGPCSSFDHPPPSTIFSVIFAACRHSSIPPCEPSRATSHFGCHGRHSLVATPRSPLASHLVPPPTLGAMADTPEVGFDVLAARIRNIQYDCIAALYRAHFTAVGSKRGGIAALYRAHFTAVGSKRGGCRHRASRVRRRFTVVAMRRRSFAFHRVPRRRDGRIRGLPSSLCAATSASAS
jgi:hypothetical protein